MVKLFLPRLGREDASDSFWKIYPHFLVKFQTPEQLKSKYYNMETCPTAITGTEPDFADKKQVDRILSKKDIVSYMMSMIRLMDDGSAFVEDIRNSMSGPGRRAWQETKKIINKYFGADDDLDESFGRGSRSKKATDVTDGVDIVSASIPDTNDLGEVVDWLKVVKPDAFAADPSIRTRLVDWSIRTADWCGLKLVFERKFAFYAADGELLLSLRLTGSSGKGGVPSVDVSPSLHVGFEYSYKDRFGCRESFSEDFELDLGLVGLSIDDLCARRQDGRADYSTFSSKRLIRLVLIILSVLDDESLGESLEPVVAVLRTDDDDKTSVWESVNEVLSEAIGNSLIDKLLYESFGRGSRGKKVEDITAGTELFTLPELDMADTVPLVSSYRKILDALGFVEVSRNGRPKKMRRRYEKETVKTYRFSDVVENYGKTLPGKARIFIGKIIRDAENSPLFLETEMQLISEGKGSWQLWLNYDEARGKNFGLSYRNDCVKGDCYLKLPTAPVLNKNNVVYDEISSKRLQDFLMAAARFYLDDRVDAQISDALGLLKSDGEGQAAFHKRMEKIFGDFEAELANEVNLSEEQERRLLPLK